MFKRPLLLVALTCALVSLTASNCVLETKEVEVPARDNEQVVFHTQGSTENNGTEDVNFTEPLLDLEADNEFVALLAADVETAHWRIINNLGDPNLQVTGSLMVEQISGPTDPGVVGVAAPVSLLDYQTVNISDGLGVWVLADLNEAGVDLMNGAFSKWLLAHNAGGNPSDVIMRFHWNATVSGGSNPPDVNFDWEAKVKFVLTGLVELEVPKF